MRKTGATIKIRLISAIMIPAALACFSAPLLAAEPELDKENLKAGLAHRVETVTSQQNPGVEREEVTSENVEIRQVEKVSLEIEGQQIPLFAVKAGLNFPDDTAASDITLVVDSSGQKQFSVQEVGSGKNPFQAAEDKLQMREISPDLGSVVYTGPGEHEVVMASTPFCPYCKTAYEYFRKNRDSIAELRMLHFSGEDESGATAAVWAIMDGKDEVSAIDLLDFVYTDLEPVDGTPQEQSEGVIAQFMERFSELDDKWGSAEQARYYLKGKYEQKAAAETQKASSELNVEATPTVYIDGISVVGWAPDRYEDLLRVADKSK